MNGGKFLEVEVRCAREEAAAREGVCPSCRGAAFMGQPVRRPGGSMGSCLCRACWAIWWFWRVVPGEWGGRN